LAFFQNIEPIEKISECIFFFEKKISLDNKIFGKSVSRYDKKKYMNYLVKAA